MKKEFLGRKGIQKEKKKEEKHSRNNINSIGSNNSSYINISRSYNKCNIGRKWDIK